MNRWAQDLAGADPIPSLPAGGAGAEASLDALAAQRRQQRMQVVIELLLQRAQGR